MVSRADIGVILVLLAGAATATAQEAEPLLRGVDLGMTVGQVMEKFPELAPEDWGLKVQADGDTAYHTWLPGLVESPFGSVGFEFREGRLIAYSGSSAREKGEFAFYLRLRDRLMTLYGEPEPYGKLVATLDSIRVYPESLKAEWWPEGSDEPYYWMWRQQGHLGPDVIYLLRRLPSIGTFLEVLMVASRSW